MSFFKHIKVVNRFHSLGNHFYSEFKPKAIKNPALFKVNNEVANLLGFTETDIASNDFLKVFSGHQLIPDSKPLAQDYAGHQLGKFNPFLGDGRAVLLFDVENEFGFWEVNLKGAGQTPYSRDFTGQASLANCVREFELSTQLASFDIPSTRGLCVITHKDNLEQANPKATAMLARIAPTFIRFGTFENYFFQKNTEALTKLTDYVIRYYYPEYEDAGEERLILFFNAVVQRTARLIAKWQTVGFTHGMMNTDNMSIIGISLDLGEAAFNEEKDPQFVSSSNDEKGRYAFGEQPIIGLWNCNVLARALSPIISQSDLKHALQTYETEYLNHYESLMAKT